MVITLDVQIMSLFLEEYFMWQKEKVKSVHFVETNTFPDWL